MLEAGTCALELKSSVVGKKLTIECLEGLSVYGRPLRKAVQRMLTEPPQSRVKTAPSGALGTCWLPLGPVAVGE